MPCLSLVHSPAASHTWCCTLEALGSAVSTLCLGCLSSWTHLSGRLLFQVKSPRKLFLTPLNQPKPHILSAIFLDFSFVFFLKILLISPLSIKCTYLNRAFVQSPSLFRPSHFFYFSYPVSAHLELHMIPNYPSAL